jgi:hypothetical protein
MNIIKKLYKYTILYSFFTLQNIISLHKIKTVKYVVSTKK